MQLLISLKFIDTNKEEDNQLRKGLINNNLFFKQLKRLSIGLK